MANAKKFVVAVYMVDRQYGGPEEGGWYYDAGELVRTMRVFGNQDTAYSYSNRMNALFKATLNRGRRSISSVLSEGQYRARVCDDCAPRYFPEQRPHYE